MGPQMNTILLLLIFTGLVGMLLVVFFMLDRVNEIHKHSDIPQRGHIDPAAMFGGLTGKNLWDALIGVPIVLAYTAWVYRVLWGRTSTAALSTNPDLY